MKAEDLALKFSPRPINCSMGDDWKLAVKDAQVAIDLLSITPVQPSAASGLPPVGTWSYKVQRDCCAIFQVGEDGVSRYVCRTDNAASANFIVEACNGYDTRPVAQREPVPGDQASEGAIAWCEIGSDGWLTLKHSSADSESDTKTVYVKRWRTLVKLPAKYADEIVEALRIAQPQQAGEWLEGEYGDTYRRLTAIRDGAQLEMPTARAIAAALDSLLYATQPQQARVLEREVIAKAIDEEAWAAINDGRDALPGSMWGKRREWALRKADAILLAITHVLTGPQQSRERIAIATALARKLCQLFDSGGESQRSVRARHASAIFQLLNADAPEFLSHQAQLDADPVLYLATAENYALTRPQRETE